MPQRRPFRRARFLVASSLVAVTATVVVDVGVSTVVATSDLSLSVSAPGEQLLTDPTLIDVTMNAQNPVGGDGLNGFNGSFTAILTAGASLVGSTVAPKATSTLVDGRTAYFFENVGDIQEGSSLQLGLSVSVPAATFPVGSTVDVVGHFAANSNPRRVPDFDPATGTFSGDTTGATPTGSSSTLLVPLTIDKSSLTVGAEDEQLRGVHDHVATYQLLVTNNAVADDNLVVVDDFVPAAFEFLGCGGVDNTTDATGTNAGSPLEYPGAPSLAATAPPAGPCPAPVLVESVSVTAGVISSGSSTDGTVAPATVADGVYTHVRWNLGTLTPADFAAPVEIRYQVGVPILRNTHDPAFNTESGTDPTANLDNNIGAFTTEDDGAEQSARNFSQVRGVYTGPTAPGFDPLVDTVDDDEYVVSVEDLSIHKSATVSGAVVQGSRVQYELQIETSEYRNITDAIVTDTLGDGQCPLRVGGADPEAAPQSGECAVAGNDPSFPFASVSENADGSFVLVWDRSTAPVLADLPPNSNLTITFVAQIRESYQEDFVDQAPFNGADGVNNGVGIAGTTNLVAGIPDNPAVDASPIQDESSTGISAQTATIDKSISLPVAPGGTLDCNAATWVRTDPAGAASPRSPAPLQSAPYAYRLGDRVCFRLGVDFVGNLNFRNARVDDFLPSGMAFEQVWQTPGAPSETDGSGNPTGASANNEVVIEAIDIVVDPQGDLVTWTLGEQDPDTIGSPYENDLFVRNGGERFEVIVSAVITDDPVDRANADIVQNLQKFTSSNLQNETVSLRDSADFAVVEPNLSTSKSADVAVAVEGDTIIYTSSVTNDFETPPGTAPAFADDFAAATNVSAWDVLPSQITCAEVSNIALSAAGATNCVDGIGPAGRSVIDFVINRIDPQDTVDLTYEVTLPAPTVAGQTLVNELGVRTYEGTPSNDGDPGNDPTFVPSNNIDPSLEPSANTGDARSSATVRTPLPNLAKEQQSSFGDSSNSRNGVLAQTADEAAVSEFVRYRVRGATIPEGTTVYNAALDDTLPTGLRFVSFDSVTLDDGNGTVTDLIASPGGFTLAQSGQDIDLTFPATYTNPSGSGDDEVAIVLTAIVEDVATNTAGRRLDNTATLAFETAPTGGQIVSVSSNTVRLTVIEPRLEVDVDTTLADGSIVRNPACDDVRGNDTATSNDPDGAPTNGCDVLPGDTLWQKVAVTNSGSANAYDAQVVAVVPPLMTPLATALGSPVVDGGTVTGPSGSVGTWDLATRTITWDPTTVPALAGPIDPVAAPIVLDFHAVLAPSAVLNDDQDFTTTVQIPEYFGLPPAERNADTSSYGDSGPGNPNGRGPVDPDEATVEVHFPDVSVDKRAVDDFSDARLGQSFRFQLRVSNADATATAFDVDVTDVLPAGWSYDPGSATPSAPTVAGQTLTWTDTFDVLPGQTVTIAYTATPDAIGLANVASTGYDGGSGPEAVPYTNTVDITAADDTGAPGNADGPYEGSDDQTVYIRRTDIEVDKSISPLEADADPVNGPYFYGSFVEYTVTVVNNGPDGSTSVVVDDVLVNPPLLFDAVVSIGQGTYDDSTGVWDVGPMADGDSFDLVLRVRLTALGSVTNTAEHTANDQYDDDSTPGNDVLAEDDQDQVTIEVVPTSLGDYVFLDLNGDGVQDPGEPGIPDVEVLITFPDPADPTVTRQYTATTNSDGQYSLPPRFVDENTSTIVGTPTLTDITVDIVEANSPHLAGLIATDGAESDVDGGADGISTQQIVPGDPSTSVLPDGTNARLDVDFGYEPQGQSLGDRVWWDQDQSADATDDDPGTATEFGLPTVTVTATWYGFDGVLGTADDLVFVTTTSDGTVDVTGDGSADPSGTYRFTNLPPGQFEVEVDTATLTNDLTDQTYDLDGIVSASIVEGITLDPGENQLDVDFSYSGPGEVGDTVWYDFDGDGVQGVNEPGIAGVDVDVVWFGPDGLEATVDDVTITLTTSSGSTDVDGDGAIDPAGAYYIDGLPTGGFRVGVDVATLPGSMSATADGDDADPTGIVTPNTSLTTLTAVDRSDLDQDFGYGGDLNLGDMIWWDVDADGNTAPDAIDLALPGVPVTVTWAGNDGIFGTPDDFTTSVVTSDGTVDTNGDGTAEPVGDYVVSGLPDGDYRVEVDATGVLTDLGLTMETYDFDGPGDGSSATTLAGADDLDQDFSYTGVGVIGDTVWYDVDEDGAVGPAEPGLSGVDVQLTWAGLDGVLGSPDDQVFTTTTSDGTVDVDGDGSPDPIGTYRFENLPVGDHEIVIDPGGTTLPPGVELVSDPDGTLDGTSRVTLTTAVPEDLDQDFGYSGLGSVGDTVWLDLDSDGVRSPADPGTGYPAEPGIPGVDVEVRWVGVDGVPGTSDDYVIVVTTSDGTQDVDGDGTVDPVGFYRVPDLPFGDVVVTVDATSGLLPDLTQTSDASGPLDHSSTVTLAADDPGTPDDEADDVGQDFGYAGRATLGDLVFYDRDANGTGVVDGLDVPIPGVTVDLTWGGFDGVIGDDPITAVDESLDDLVYAITTDAAGGYLVTDLPPGTYSVEVDDTTLPIGIDIPTYDVDGTADGATTVTLGATDDRRDVDFSFTGNAGVGDTVFIDIDGDGVLDPDEVGLAGVTLTATYLAPDGSTIVVPVQTSDGTQDVNGDGNPDPIGTYFVDNLPFDVPITITVDGTTLPPELAASSDPDGTLDNITTVTLTTAAPLDLDQDFGYDGPGVLGDTVFYDADGVGTNVPDGSAGDVGLPNVTLTAVWGGRDGVIGDDPTTPQDESIDDMTVTTVTGDGTTDVDGDGATDPAGTYRFPNLPFGVYEITVDAATLPAGTDPVFDPDGGADLAALASLDSVTPQDLAQDFSVTGTGALGDTVWEDTDADGVIDPDEAGVPGVVVTMTYTDPITGFTTTRSTTTSDGTTDPVGTYRFDHLPAGDYTVEYDSATLPRGFGPASDPDTVLDGTVTLTLGDGEENLAIDFGVRPTANVTGIVFEDTDGDGVQGPREPGIEGVSVEVTDGTGRTITVVTDPDGNYSVDGVLAGDVIVDVVDDTVPDGLELSTGNDRHTIDAVAGETTPAEPIGYAPLTFISGTIWYDIDAAGDRDLTDPRLAGVTVDLLDTDGAVVATTTTNTAGFYQFLDVPTGEYSIRVAEATLPAGLDRRTFDPDGTLDGTHQLTLGSTGSIDNNFGYTGTGTIADTIWVDGNRNGALDPGERRVGGVVLNVTWAGPDGVLGTADDVTRTASSDANGNVSIDNLPAGRYQIAVDIATVPAGLTLAAPSSVTVALDAGGSLDLDSFPLVSTAIPRTGGDPWNGVATALVLLAAGLVLVAAAYRRRATAA